MSTTYRTYNKDLNENFFKRTWGKIKAEATRIKHSLEENPELIIPLISGIAAAGTTAVNVGTGIARERRLTKEQNDKDRRVYDPETGMSYELRRPMSNSQKLEYSRRLKNRDEGESRAEVLEDMRLLK